VKRVLAVACQLSVCALMLASPAHSSDRHPTLLELEGELMCPVCETTLDQSDSPAAAQIERAIMRMIKAGETKSQIKRELVAQYGPSILAAPEKHGFGLLAWLLPLVGLFVGAVAIGGLAWRWSRSRDAGASSGASQQGARVALAPDVERRLDEELARFDS
jgi:cytochrome c-type biogenesis protein CcmH